MISSYQENINIYQHNWECVVEKKRNCGDIWLDKVRIAVNKWYPIHSNMYIVKVVITGLQSTATANNERKQGCWIDN